MSYRQMAKLRHSIQQKYHHYVYVVLLSPAAGRLRKVAAINPDHDRVKPCIYVGMSGLKPEERFLNHKRGIKASSIVKRYGLWLMPELYEYLNPMTYEEAVQMEQDLAEELRLAGYSVTGGH